MSGAIAAPTQLHSGPRMSGPRYPGQFGGDPGGHHTGGPPGGFHHHQSRPRLGYQPYRLYPRPLPAGGGIQESSGQEYDGRRLRKSLVRKTVDYNAAIIKAIQVVFTVIKLMFILCFKFSTNYNSIIVHF